MKPLYFCLLIAGVLMGCSPKVKQILYQERPSLPETSIVGLLDDMKTADSLAMEKLGQVYIGDGGLTLYCDYETTLYRIKQEALKMGGNFIYILEHKEPDGVSTCHRLRAMVYYTTDPGPLEKRIYWRKDRKLMVQDFKGTSENRPFQAATFSSVEANPIILPGKPPILQIQVDAVFDCYESYMDHSEQSFDVLAHEQLHFDITELFARKLRKEIKESVHDVDSWNDKGEELFDVISGRWKLYQDAYDAEVYSDLSRQPSWNEKVAKELEEYEEFAATFIRLPLEKK